MIPRKLPKNNRQVEIRPHPSVTKSGARAAARIPTGFRPPALRCEGRATLGHRQPSRSNRNAVAAPAFSFIAPDVCHNPDGVDPHDLSFTQGSSCLATLGWVAQPRWGWTDSRLARIFHNCFDGRGQNRRSAGFQTCCIADFQIGRVSQWRGVRGFGNPRYSRLGSLRYGSSAVASLFRRK